MTVDRTASELNIESADDHSRRERPLRVLWLIKGLGPGGAEHLLLASARVGDRSRFHYEVSYLLPWKDALVERIEALGVPARCLGVRDERDLRWVVALRRRLRREPVDVVHVHSPYVAAMTRLAVASLRPSQRPVVVSTEHNAWTGFNRFTRLANASTAWLDRATIAVSDETRDSMSKRQRARCEVLMHGVDVASIASLRDERDSVRSEFGIDGDTVVFGTVANYHPKKDWPNLLRAARAVADSGRRMHWLAVGQGPLEAEVHELHEELGLVGIVTLTGFRPDATRVMAACDAFVLGSRWEGLPVAVMEATALGLPLVCTGVGGIAEQFRDGRDALLVAPQDPAALAAAMMRVVDDGALRAQLAAASAERAHDFDATRAQRRIEAIYMEALVR